jgi:hypothetical protein
MMLLPAHWMFEMLVNVRSSGWLCHSSLATHPLMAREQPPTSAIMIESV